MRKLYWLSISIFFCISACTKIESTTIGSGLIPPIDGVTTIDTTLAVYTNNFIDKSLDSLKVYKTDEHVIGIIKDDPFFGKTTASAFFELKPTSYPNTFSTTNTLIADSAVLILSYKGVYGDTAIPQDWEVRELSENIQGDTIFNVKETFRSGDLLGQKTINIPSLKDSINYGFEQARNQIRIKLSSDFARKIIERYKSGTEYKNDTTFRQNFKGFVVQPTANSQGNALIRINLLDTNTKLALFYKYKKTDASANNDTTVSYFRFSNGSVIPVSGNANNIVRNYTGSQFSQFNNSASNAEFAFIQTAPGTFATVKIPGLRSFPNAIIHRAELLTFQAPDPSAYYNVLTPPRFLLLSSYDSVNKVKTNIPNDFILSSNGINLETFGGYLTRKSVPGVNAVYAYTFDLSRYVQGIVTRKDSSYTLRLTAPSNDSIRYKDPYPSTTPAAPYYLVPSNANNVAEGRVRLGGGGMSTTAPLRMRLRIIYSRI
jgi:hypothetical protein